jgi:phenylpropionate dioxygenase-like ring-hydroxylating dioxygenase large terminal subunit
MALTLRIASSMEDTRDTDLGRTSSREELSRRTLTDPDRAVSRRFPFSPYPTGWFRVAASSALKPGQVLTVRYFGKELVLFRGESGAPVLLDAHCPHLGAHLGLGQVRGDKIECPFHGWCFDRAGTCTSVPYARKIPPKAVTRAWPVCEANGVVMAWYHPRREPPTWQFPVFAESTDPAFTPFNTGPRWPRMRTHVQELAENGMDMAHFSVVHGQQTRRAVSRGVETDGPRLIHRTHQTYNLFWLARRLAGEVHGPLDVHCHGPGASINRTVVHAKIELTYAFVFFYTPIDEEHVEVNSQLCMRRVAGPLITRLLLAKASREGRRILDQDQPIWETKAYRATPVLAEGEGPIMAYRRWMQQFHEPYGEPQATSLAAVLSVQA